MAWWLILIILVGSLISVLMSGMPVAFAFLLLNCIGFVVFFGGIDQIALLVPSAFESIAVFTLVVVPLFILMGEMLYHTGLAGLMIDNIGKWIGRVPGSLSLIGIVSGTVFAMMSGSSMSGVVLFGSTLGPEMTRRGYKKQMIYGPILGAGSLAMMIPPSTMNVIVATMSQQSVGKLLIASVVPGFILAALYFGYILVRSRLQPHLAPAFGPPRVTWSDRIKGLLLIAPLSIIIFLVLGLIFVGATTPTEAAALGTAGTFVLAAAYRKLSWQAVKKALSGTIAVTGMVFMILISSTAFSQLLAYTGVIRELGKLATSSTLPPIVIVIFMQVIMIIMGMFMEALPMGMILIPIFFPVIRSLGLDPMWFGILMLLNMECGGVSPPFGILVYTLKGVVPDISLSDLFRAGLPIFLLMLTDLIIIVLFPQLVTWLPSLMMGV